MTSGVERNATWHDMTWHAEASPIAGSQTSPDRAARISLEGVHEIDPLRDSRWPAFVNKHTRSSVFHTVGWLEALQRTYGCEPRVLARLDTTNNVVDALVYCRMNSWLTGRRFVSLPFSDHCEPLVEDQEALASLVVSLQREVDSASYRYLELRPISPMPAQACGLGESQRFCLHRLDLSSGLNKVFERFHRDCVQRKIRRAEREKLSIAEGRTPHILAQFYRLVVQTRRRQGLPPQPFAWFKNLVGCLGTDINIRIASKNDEPIAGIVTIQHKRSLIYKYGASDERFHNLGGMAYLFWIAIQDAINGGLSELDMGRSDLDNPGLIAFKERWGASCATLSYWRYPITTKPRSSPVWKRPTLQQVFRLIPDRCLCAVGSVLYRHVG